MLELNFDPAVPLVSDEMDSYTRPVNFRKRFQKVLHNFEDHGHELESIAVYHETLQILP